MLHSSKLSIQWEIPNMIEILKILAALKNMSREKIPFTDGVQIGKCQGAGPDGKSGRLAV